MTEHEHVVEQLTWLVNGTLGAREQNRVLQHLEQCALCRSELAMQQRVRNAIAQTNKIEFAPQTSFNKLWDRIGSERDANEPRTGQVAVTVACRQWLRALRQHWMPVALAAQLLMIVGLVSVLLMDSGNSDGNNSNYAAAYRTVTSSSDPDRPIIHAVFDEATRLTDVKDILGKAGLEVAAGPTATGVYSLTPDKRRDIVSLNDVVASLRADPRVRFAELSHP